MASKECVKGMSCDMLMGADGYIPAKLHNGPPTNIFGNFYTSINAREIVGSLIKLYLKDFTSEQI